ncbi:MAG: Maf family protein, partial [Kiritimatiellae bacterium]|nr:Maf family protein [Kiritimatiellia bacterium]
MTATPLVLASASPRRAAILRAIGAEFSVLAADAAEPRTEDPVESVALAAAALELLQKNNLHN